MAGATRAVFLSYRREETRHIAGRLADRLTERLGPAQVFMDVETIEPGADFTATIARAVASCRILIALIGPTWATASSRRRRRRLEDPDDLVVLEIRAALERGIPVIPVLVDGARMPDRDELPEALQGLVRRNAVRLDHDTFRSDITVVLTAVDRILSAPAPTTPEPTVNIETSPTSRAPEPPPQQTATPNSLEVPPSGQEKGAGGHPRSPSIPFSPIPWLRARPRLLTAIVITSAVAVGIALLLSINDGGQATSNARRSPAADCPLVRPDVWLCHAANPVPVYRDNTEITDPPLRYISGGRFETNCKNDLGLYSGSGRHPHRWEYTTYQGAGGWVPDSKVYDGTNPIQPCPS